jgi:hypothetical protein
MKLYIAICEDRHLDTTARAFDTPEKAIAYAKAFVEEHCYHPEKIVENICDDCLYSCSYSVEDNFVYVEETWLNDEQTGKEE